MPHPHLVVVDLVRDDFGAVILCKTHKVRMTHLSVSHTHIDTNRNTQTHRQTNTDTRDSPALHVFPHNVCAREAGHKRLGKKSRLPVALAFTTAL